MENKIENLYTRRRRALFRLCFFALLMLGGWLAPPAAQATITGSGTQADPYTINTTADWSTMIGGYQTSGTYLAGLVQGKSYYWKLNIDVTFNQAGIAVICPPYGLANSSIVPFRGGFDGGGHTLTITYPLGGSTTYSYGGVFAQTQNVTIKNLNVVYNATTGWGSYAGGLIGEAWDNTTIDNVKITQKSGYYIGISQYLFGGLIGCTGSLSTTTGVVNISRSYVQMSVQLGEGGGQTWLDSGGLIGRIEGVSSATLSDCYAAVNMSFSTTDKNFQTLGGLVGAVKSNLNLIRCVAVNTVPGAGSHSRGNLIGGFSNNVNFTCIATYCASGPVIASDAGGASKLNGFSNYFGNYPMGLATANVYNLLERTNDSGNPIASNVRGHEIWGYNGGTVIAPQWSPLVGYAVRVVKGVGINTITGSKFASDPYYYQNAPDVLTVSSTLSTTSQHQRVQYAFTPNYQPSTGNAYDAPGGMTGSSIKISSRVDGTISARVENIPYPVTPVGSFDHWVRQLTAQWTYSNPENLKGKFYVYRRESAPTSTAWAAEGSPIAVQTGSNIPLSITTGSINIADLGNTYEFLVGFYEGDTAPASPNDIAADNKVVIPVLAVPALGNWGVTTVNAEHSITVNFTADSRLVNSPNYSYTIQRSANGGSYDNIATNQSFNGATAYSYVDNNPGTSCDYYNYKVIVSVYGYTFESISDAARITGSTQFVKDDPFKASKGEYANYVRLQWKVDRQSGGGDETYRVFRRIANTTDPFLELETVTSNTSTVYWNDNNALTGIYYEYKLTLYQVCTGNETELDSKTDVGFTQSFGLVSGRVTYGSGNSVSGVNMLVRRNELKAGESQYYSLKGTGGGQRFEWLADSAYFNNIYMNKAWTLQFWVRPDNTNTGTDISIGVGPGFRIKMDSVAGGYQIYTDASPATKSEVIPANKYSHITISRADNSVTIYTVCDQQPDSIYIKNKSYTAAAPTTLIKDSCRIAFGFGLSGNIDDVRFWNRTLPESEITRDYSRRLTGSESGLVGYWTFDESLKGYAFDMSHVGTTYNGHHATTNTLENDTIVPNEVYQLALKGITDSDGNYQIGGIPYSGEGTSYSIVPSMGVHVFNPTQQLRYISPTSMVHNSTDFIDISSFIVSGTVVYDGGTYPVSGCSFQVDDQPLTRPNGEMITSDYDGQFSISVPIGIHKVRVVKQGHTFANDGYLRDETTGANLNYNAPVSYINFFDQTKVKLVGRVVGGAIEDDQPLGFGETHNNIGVQTIRLLNTRTQYDFVTTPVSQSYTHNQGQWKKPSGLADDSTTVDYNQDDLTIHVSPLTGEFVAMVYPEPYNIDKITVPGANGTQVTVYDNNEMIDLTSSAVPDDSYLKTSTRTWTDSTFIANKPGVMDHWEYSNKTDTIRYNASWKYFYSATPTFGMQQVVNNKPVDFFGESSYVVSNDLTAENDTIDVYNQTTGQYLFGKPVFQQGEEYTFRFNAYEQYTNYVDQANPVTMQYPVKDGIVAMTNNVRIEPQPESIAMDSTGVADYTFMAGAPNLTTATNNFFATLSLGSVSYYWDMGQDPYEVWHLGDKSTGTNFMTSGPDELTAILRDPPGSKSSAFIEKGTTFTSTSNTTASTGITEELNLTTSLGPMVKTFLGLGGGVIIESEIKADVVAGLSMQEKYSTENETSLATTFTERFQTSDDALYVGALGDVFIGNSTNILYGMTNGIHIQKGDNIPNSWEKAGGYSIAPSASISYGQTFATRFAYTSIELETIMLPKWQQSIATRLLPVGTTFDAGSITEPQYVSKLAPDDPNFGKSNIDKTAFPKANLLSPYDGDSYKIYFPANYVQGSDALNNFQDSVIWANNQINTWMAVMAQNEQEKVQMSIAGNYSFGGGANIQYSQATKGTSSYKHTFNLVMTPTIGATVGGDVMGIGLSLETKVTTAIDNANSTSTSTENTVTTGFTLAEEGDDDELTVDYGLTSSGTFAFKTRGGQTSCPYEGEVRTKYYQPGNYILSEATMQIEVPKISVISAPQVVNVPSNRTASFTLALQNESETKENEWFQLIVDEVTNPDGADLKIDGAAIGNGRLFLVKAGETLQKTLTLGKGAVDTYNNIAIILRSQCQSDPTNFLPVIADTTFISAQFIPAVSEVAITDPASNWILNAEGATHDTLYVNISKYDLNFPNFGYIKLEYRPISSPTWSTITTFYPSSLYAKAMGVKEDIGTRSVLIYPWKTPEQDGQYELRATTASVNSVDGAIIGDPLSTYSTPAVGGWKDVHRPTSLGAPSPANGILSASDELSITFNEDIQTGMLTQNNFDISGILNAQEIAEPNVGLAFAGSQSAYTEAPIYTGGSFSIETWFKRDMGSTGTLFAYGSNSNYLSLGFDASGEAILKSGSDTFTSSTLITDDDTWKYVALAYNRQDSTVSVFEYEGSTSKTLFMQKKVAAPETEGKLYVGNNATASDGFEGATAQLHFYGIQRDDAAISADKSLTMSGKEYGLIGYWPMEEGSGSITTDKARARNLVLNTDWYIYPSGLSKQTTSTNYFQIPTATYPLDVFSDFSLEFWMRSADTNQANTTLVSGDKGSIGIDANKALVLYKSDGTVNQVLSTANLMDTQWHHFTLSVKRGGSAKVYVDGVSTAVFNESLIGSFASGYYYFGAYHAPDNTMSRNFSGYFDDIRIWNSALTLDGIKLDKDSKLRGDEAGLVAYYPFETYTKQSSGLITVAPTDVSITNNSMTDKTVNTTLTGTAVTSTTAMSLKDVRPTESVPFSYVASNNKIVFTLDPNYFARVEGTTLNVSVQGILDMRNNMSSVESWTAYVNRNALLWDSDPISLTLQQGENKTFTARIVNTGGATVSYSIENLPSWLSVSNAMGTLQALANKDLTFTVNPAVNIGNYEVAIGLVSGNGVSEVLPVQLKVTGIRPDWSVNMNDFEQTMTVTGQIQIEGIPQEDDGDILAAFIDDRCVGVVSPQYESTFNAYFVYMTIGGNSEDNSKDVTFKLWDASTGNIYPEIELSRSGASLAIQFLGDDIEGTPNEPVIFNAINVIEQSIALSKGWNWISVNVSNDNPELIDQLKKKSVDFVSMIKAGNGSFLQKSGSNWIGILASLSNMQMYSVNTTQNATLNMTGNPVDPGKTPIDLKTGWNWIGYTPQVSLPVADALAGVPNPKQNDMIKGRSAFRQYSTNGWIGSLIKMEPGQGYKYKSANDVNQQFYYPKAASGLRSSDISSNGYNELSEFYWTANDAQFDDNMTVTTGIFIDQAEVLNGSFEIAAFCGEECRGVASMQYIDGFDHPYMGFLMVYGKSGETMQFRIYDHSTGETYLAEEKLSFIPDAINGTPDDLFFLRSDEGFTDIDGIDKNEIVIFPNPVKDELFIRHDLDILKRVKIFDISGKLLMEKDNFTDSSIDVSSLKQGSYFIHITSDKQSFVNKFTKK